MAAVLVNPSRYLLSVKNGIILFWSTVLPALFPFFFFTRLLSGLGFPDSVGKTFEKPVKFLFKTPKISAYVFFMSVLSGYPIGAKLVSEFYKNNIINAEESKKIISFCSTSAPLFVIGTIGTFMLENILQSVVILIAHYLSAIVTGLLFCNVKPLSAKNVKTTDARPVPENLIGESVNDSVISILSVGGLIAIFGLLIDVLSDIGFFSLFGNAAPFVAGIFEMTRGAKEIIKNPPEVHTMIAALTALVSFGGICIFLQAMTFLAEAKIKARYYLAVKTFQAAAGAGIAYLISLPLF